MALTEPFEETVLGRARRDRGFRLALLKEAAELFLAGDVEIGKTMLRTCVNATIGFDKLGTATKKSPKSLMRMLGPNGNPHSANLFAILSYLQKKEKIRFVVQTKRVTQRARA
jgi:hypothetical protein